jgi:hypothetical protein
LVRVQIEAGPALSNKAMFVVRDDRDRRGYLGSDTIMTDRDLRAQVIASAKKELETFVTKYVGILAMGTYVPRLHEVIDQMRDEIDQLATDAQRRRAVRSTSFEEVRVNA